MENNIGLQDEHNPLVSVIIPVYNRADLIRETIESVLKQTYQNIEIIVVDDGSTDNSIEILNEFSKKIKLFQHPGKINKGQAAAINLGLKMAKGSYIAILDSDDLFYPLKIEKQVEYLNSHLEKGIVYSNGMNIDFEGSPLYTLYPAGDRPPIGPEAVLENCAFNLPSNALVRKNVFDQVGFLNESLRSAQDHEMAIRLAEISDIGYIDDILWGYRRHGNSISHTRTTERWKNGFRILSEATQRYPYPVKTRLRRKAVLHFRLGQCYIGQKKIFTAFFHFACAAFWDPQRSLKVLFKKERISNANS